METTFRPCSMRSSIILREVWLFPAPVLVEQTDITGFVLLIEVCLGLSRRKSAPAVLTTAARAMT